MQSAGILQQDDFHAVALVSDLDAAVPATGDGELPSTGTDLGLLVWALALITSGAMLITTRRPGRQGSVRSAP